MVEGRFPMKSAAFVILILFLLLILLGYLISDLMHLKEELDYLKDENWRLRQTLEDQQTKSNELKAENQALRQEAERLKQALAHERDLKEKATSELHSLQQQVEKMLAPMEANQNHPITQKVLPSKIPQFSDLEIVSSLAILSSTSVIIFGGLLFTLKNPQKRSNSRLTKKNRPSRNSENNRDKIGFPLPNSKEEC